MLISADLAGDLVRPDIRETQTGVDLLLDVQFLNVHTCEPLPKVIVDFWHCNSTGRYAGFSAEGTSVSGHLIKID